MRFSGSAFAVLGVRHPATAAGHLAFGGRPGLTLGAGDHDLGARDHAQLAFGDDLIALFQLPEIASLTPSSNSTFTGTCWRRPP